VLQFDEEASRRIEATYMTPDVVGQRRIVLASLELQRGEAVLDVGSGPGLLAAEIAEAVGPKGTVHGIEPSEAMLAIAARREPAAGSAPLQFQPGDAVAMPFADASFDAVVSTQVYEYLEDVAGALAEVHRVLRPGGRLVVLDTDWGSVVWRCNDAERMRRVLAAWDEHLADPYLPRRLTGLLEDAGFTLTDRAAVPILNAGYDPDTYSAGLIGFVSAFVPGHHGLTEADAATWAEELIALGRDYFFSVNRYVFAAQATASSAGGSD
jgi:ubiquinone/menaquinone biosynthesis C-methylase UbiE